MWNSGGINLKWQAEGPRGSLSQYDLFHHIFYVDRLVLSWTTAGRVSRLSCGVIYWPLKGYFN
jgi:hypothetical protein